MRGYSDDWLEKQLHRKICRYRLPGPRTLIFPDDLDKAPPSLCKLVNLEFGCRPILALIDTPEHWTLLCTASVLFYDHGAISQVKIENVLQIMPSSMDQIPRNNNEQLELTDYQQRIHTIWAPAGPEFFAFWSLLKWLIKLPIRRVADNNEVNH